MLIVNVRCGTRCLQLNYVIRQECSHYLPIQQQSTKTRLSNASIFRALIVPWNNVITSLRIFVWALKQGQEVKKRTVVKE